MIVSEHKKKKKKKKLILISWYIANFILLSDAILRYMNFCPGKIISTFKVHLSSCVSRIT